MTNKIRVLSVCSSDSFGGAARAAYRIHLAVKEYGIESRMLVKHKDTSDTDIMELEQFLPQNSLYKTICWLTNKIENKRRKIIWRMYPKRTEYFMSDLSATDINGALDKIDYDILHLHWINSQFLSLKHLPKDKPIVWTLHDSWPFCGICHYFLNCDRYIHGCGLCPHLNSLKENDLSRVIWKKKQKAFSNLNLNFVSPSKWLSQCASESLLLKNRPITVIPNCLDTTIFKPLCTDEILPRILKMKDSFNGKSIILFGAANASKDRIKGATIFLEALKYLEDNGYSKRLGVIIFGVNEKLEGIPSTIASYQIGYLDTCELVSLYNISSVVAVPSITEVFGQVASEAMSCGKPVVAFKCTGIKEIVGADCGYLAQPYSSEDFAKGILWCLDNNKDGLLSNNARDKVLGQYTPSIIGKLYSDFYKKLI